MHKSEQYPVVNVEAEESVHAEKDTSLSESRIPKDSLSDAAQPIDFSCGVCGVECAIAPDPPARAVCPKHCEDHNYVHDSSRAGKFCEYCDQEQPEDWR
jgi:hypothetical protein